MNTNNHSPTPQARTAIFSGLRLPRFIADLSLQVKITVAFLLITIIPLALLTFLNDRSVRQALIDEANQALLTGATETANKLDDFIQTNLDGIRTLAQLPALVDYLTLPVSERVGSHEEEEIIATLTALRRQDPINIASYALFNEQGIDLVDTFTPDIGIDKSNRNYFQAPLDTGLPYVSPVQHSPTMDEAGLYFSSPVRDGSGQIIGVLRVRYRASVLQALVTQKNDAAGTETFAILLNENHVRLAHGIDPDLIFKSVVPLEPELFTELQIARQLPNGSLEELSTNIPDFEQGLNNLETTPYFNTKLVALDNNLSSVAVTKLDTQPWFLAFSQPQAVAIAPINAQTRTAAILVAIVMVIVVIIALVMGQLISRPVKRLTAVAEQITQGNFSAQAVVESGDEIGVLAQTFNTMTGHLQVSLADLEQHALELEQQTRIIQTSIEVSRQLSAIVDEQELVVTVAEQLQKAFNYYHAHIYLLDETGHSLVMAGGTGNAGMVMLNKGHQVPIGKGLVGRAAATKLPVLVTDVLQEPNWLPNELLPLTKTETAVPILSGNELIGVIDVQDTVVGKLRQQDVELIQSIANQFVIAYQNARNYIAQQKRAEYEAQINEIRQKIQATTEVDGAMQIAVRELGTALGAKRTAVRLTNRSEMNNGNN